MVTGATQDLVVCVESEKVPTVEVNSFRMTAVRTEIMRLDRSVTQVV